MLLNLFWETSYKETAYKDAQADLIRKNVPKVVNAVSFFSQNLKF
jgi:hypothetical protein